MNFFDIHTHLLHDFHAIAEREYDTLLGSTHQMSLRVLVEVNAIDRTTDLLILEHTLSTVTEWDNRDALTTDRHRGGQIVHLGIANLRGDVTMCPSIQDTRTIDTQQHTQTRLVGSMVHMSKSIYTALLVVVHFTQHTIYHARCSGSCGNLAWIQHIQ